MSVTQAWAISASARRSNDERRYVVKYRVITNDPTDGPWVASSASVIPGYLSTYAFGGEVDRGAYRTDITVDLTNVRDSFKDWLVTCDFTNKPPAWHPDVLTIEDPVMLPPEISGDFLLIQVPLTRDKDGNSIVNSAGDYFEGLTDEESCPTLVIAKNYNTVDLSLLSNYVPSVNSTAFWGMGARYWKLQKAPWQRLWKANGVPYYRITYEFQLNWQTWDYKPADRGWYKADNYQKVRVTDKDGIPLSVQEWLDGDGNALDLSSQTYRYWDGVSVKDSGPVMESFRAKRERNFALLGVPMSL